MTWFKVDDGFATHRKVDALGSDQSVAVGCWVLLGTACSRDLTDGVVTRAALARTLALWTQKDRDRAVAALVRVGLWEPVEDGWIFHDWTRHQPSRLDVEANRESAKLRQQRARDRRVTPSVTRDEAVTNAVTDRLVTPLVTRDKAVSHTTPTRPDPARPETESKACVISEAEQPAAPEARTGESARAHTPGGTTYVTGQQTLADTFRAAVEQRYRAANLPAPKVCRDPYDAVWAELARWLHEAHKLRGWSHSKPDMAREMVRAFYASTDPRTVAAKHNIKYLAARPEEYLGLKVPT